jgi:ABC-type multidrug transport system fused ATPase/permease subunit
MQSVLKILLFDRINYSVRAQMVGFGSEHVSRRSPWAKTEGLSNMEKNTPVIEFAKLKFSFSDTRVLFENLSLKLNSGSFYLIRGPSGSGKSTFLRLINRLEEPSAGDIFFNSRRLASYSPPLLRRSILYIQQTPTAIDGTVRQNLLLGFTFKNNRTDSGRGRSGAGHPLSDHRDGHAGGINGHRIADSGLPGAQTVFRTG